MVDSRDIEDSLLAATNVSMRNIIFLMFDAGIERWATCLTEHLKSH